MTEIRSEISGSVWKVLAGAGQVVAEGDELLILESMKMEIPVVSPTAGVVEMMHAAEADEVTAGQLLATVSASAS
jgi:biotin carboxyl carrier protein